jgi:hypothetical protein
MSATGNRNGPPLSKGSRPSGDKEPGSGATDDIPMRNDEREAQLAGWLDDDLPAEERREMERVLAGDAAAARTVAEMRTIQNALRGAGPASAPDGFLAAVLRRAEADREQAEVLRLHARHERRLVLVQAASIALMLFAYAGLFGASRIHEVRPRWDESAERAAHPADAGASIERTVPSIAPDYRVSTRPCVSTGTSRDGTVARIRPSAPSFQPSIRRSSPGYVTFAKRA